MESVTQRHASSCVSVTSSEDWDRVWYGWDDLMEVSTGGEVEEEV